MQETETRELPVRLMDSELKQKSGQLVRSLQDLDAVRGERDEYLAAVKTAKDEFKKREGEFDKRIRQLGHEIANGSERRQVECRLMFYWERGQVEIVRIDTGEVVDARAITAEERQQKMPFAGAGAEASESVM